jgi:large conductance mechanosensitive channel
MTVQARPVDAGVLLVGWHSLADRAMQWQSRYGNHDKGWIMTLVNEFKAFILRGNVMDLAVGVIIGAAFGKIVTSLTEDMIMPIVSLTTGGINFSNKFVVLGTIPATYKGSPQDYVALKAAGVALFGYGSFLTNVINFVLMAFVIFLMVKLVSKAMPKAEAAAPPPPAGPTEIELLAEIRDSLRARA